MGSIIDDCKQEMEQTVGAFKRDLARLRTARATTALLDGIIVEYYGATTPCDQSSHCAKTAKKLETGP